MKKKLPLVLSFVLAGLIVIGQTGFTQGSDYDQRMDNMMNECMNFMQSLMITTKISSKVYKTQ